MCMDILSARTYVLHICVWYLNWSEEGNGSLETAVTCSLKPPSRCWELNLALPEEPPTQLQKL